MQKIFKISYFVFLLTSVIIITSCNKQDSLSQNVTQVSNNANTNQFLDNINMVDGVLNFKSKDGVIKTENILNFDSLGVFTKQLNDKFPNFISALKAYKSLSHQDTFNILSGSKDYKDYVRLINENNVFSIDRTCTSLALSKLMNKNGLIMFGDSIVKLTYENAYITSKEYFNKIGKPDLELIKSSEVKIVPLIHELQKDLNKSKTEFRWNIDHNDQDFNIGGLSRRHSVVLSQDFNWFSWQLTFTNKYMYLGKWGFWDYYYDDQAEVNYHYGSITYYFPSDGSIHTSNFYDYRRDVGRLETPTLPDDPQYRNEAPVATQWNDYGVIKIYYGGYYPLWMYH